MENKRQGGTPAALEKAGKPYRQQAKRQGCQLTAYNNNIYKRIFKSHSVKNKNRAAFLCVKEI